MTTSSILPPKTSALLFFIITICLSNPFPHTTADSFKDRLHNDNYSLTKASEDYGNIVHKTPSFVLDPLSVKDIIDLTRYSFSRANASFTTVDARGNGHSIRGQVLTRGGVVVNMTALRYQNGGIGIGGNDSFGYYADVGGGNLWVNILRETLKQGLASVSWTDYLHSTVGGTLSNAGISGQTFLHGPEITNVLELDVVTGKGDFVGCSRSKNRDLFLGVLGGFGQFGIITRARIVLQKAKKMTKWVRLIYTDFAVYTNDQEYLISSNNATSYLEGFLIVSMTTIDGWGSFDNFSVSNSSRSQIVEHLKDHHILYSIELAKYYDDQAAIDQEFETLLEKLSFIPGLNFSRDVTYFDFLYRVGNLDIPEAGSTLYHPWLNIFIPKSNITDFNRLVLAGMLPRLNQTTSIIIFYPQNKNKWDDRMSAVTPTGEDVFYTLGLLHSSPNDYASYDTFNAEVLDVCKKALIQVKQYLPNYNTRAEWMKHFGLMKWQTFVRRKKQYDPKMMLAPGQGIFN